MSNLKLYYFAENYKAAIEQPRPWWQYVFYHGQYDRDDRVVDWVIRQYTPGDNARRRPLRIRRNTWLIPAVTTAGILIVVSEQTRDALIQAGSGCEFLEVVFENLYEIPWGTGIKPPLNDNASEARIEKLTRSTQFGSSRELGRHFELICPRAERCCRPVPGRPSLLVNGKLKCTRTVEVGGDSIAVEMDAAQALHYQSLYHGGCGLICTEQVGEVLSQAASPEWFALDELTVEERLPGKSE